MRVKQWIRFSTWATLCGVVLIPGLAWLSPPHLSWPLQNDELFFFFSLRLPRYVSAALVGACLAQAGAAYQGLVRNSLADPYILGVSGGAALGYLVALMLGVPWLIETLFSLAGALGLMTLLWQWQGRHSPQALLLAGIMSNSLCFSLVFLAHVLYPDALQSSVYSFLLGSIRQPDWFAVWPSLILFGMGTLVLQRQGWNMNVLLAGADKAMSMGLDVKRHQSLVLAASSLLVALAVCQAGLIGFVGFMVPHAVRWLRGPDYRDVLPGSAWLGALFLMLAQFIVEHLARINAIGSEIPLGILTALCGAPLCLWWMSRTLFRKNDPW
jgi:iron complex transport system permease protein